MYIVKIIKDESGEGVSIIYRGINKKRAERIEELAWQKIDANNYSIESEEEK